MLNRVRERLTYANVMATVGVFVALGGGAYALEGRNTVDAGDLRKNAVKPPEIAKNAVRKAETAKNSVGTGEVTDGSLLEQDFAPGQLPVGEQGPQGEQGVPGQDGEDGEDATTLFAYIRDNGTADTATIQYGNGVTLVEDAAGANAYNVTFDRSVENCVVFATSGIGDPSGSAMGFVAGQTVFLPAAGAARVQITFQDAAGDPIDTAFMIAAFC